MQAVNAEFSGERSGEGPLTWGQRSMWEALVLNGHAWNLATLVDLTDARVDVPTVVALLGKMLTRNESLRTLFAVVDGEPRQFVVKSGALPVKLVSCEAAEAVETGSRLLNDQRPFAGDTEIAVRATLVVVGETVRCMVLVFYHVAVDNGAIHLMEGDFRRLLTTGSFDSEPGLQPLDIARREQIEGGPVLARAMEYWARQFRRIPPTTLNRVGPAREPRVQQATFRSDAMYAAAKRLAARHRTTPSTVLMAATALVLGSVTGNSLLAMHVQVGNRFRPEYRRVTGNLVQLGLFVLELPEKAGLDDVIPAAKQSALLAYRYAEYDLAALDHVRDEVAAERGVEVNPMCCFNVIDPTLNESDGPIPSGQEIRAAQAGSELVREDHASQPRCHFCLRVRVVQGDLRVMSLAADTGYLPPDRIDHFLWEMERVLVEAACGD